MSRLDPQEVLAGVLEDRFACVLRLTIEAFAIDDDERVWRRFEDSPKSTLQLSSVQWCPG